MDFNRYFTNDELTAQLNEWATTYPNILTLGVLGQSYEGKDIHLLTITNKATGADTDKPAVWLDANIHATEIAGTTTTLRILWELLSKYGSDEKVTRLVDTSTFYIVPRLNPDGAAWAMAAQPKYVRSGVRPYPYEKKMDGLHSQDIDGDGRILSMRIPDPNGEWKISTKNPRIMEKRKPDEMGGTYYRVFAEGLIENYDGYVFRNARPHQGLDFNRNYPFEWRTESDQYGAGPYPTSEPEIRAAVDFVAKHPNINAGIAYHTYSGVILRPYGTKADDQIDTNDLWAFQAIGERAKELTGYRTVSVFHDFKYHPKQTITGVSNDWLYENQGIFGYVIELWDIVGRATEKYERKFIDWMRDHPHEDDVKIFEWILANGPKDGYVDWYEFEHPQLGKVELGGTNNMYTWRNPPHAFMGEEAERNVPYVVALGEMLPRLNVHQFTATPLGNDQVHLNLIVENTGYFPTYTNNMSKKRGIRTVRVELDLPEGAEFVQGKRKTDLGHLEGRASRSGIFGMGGNGTDYRARAEWVIRVPSGAGAVKANVISDRAGTVQVEVTLG
ncbi:MAG: carboxypeptidase [Anaerolineales bacterium]|nr:carboxypeptidase [Anaerolineales bacterium]